MAVIVFSKPVPFPIAPLRELLTKHLPLYSWQCGEKDNGDERQMATLDEHQIISGRSPTTVIFTELRAQLGTYREAAPPHEWYLQIGAPTTDLKPVADRVVLITAMCLMIPDSDRAYCQLKPGGNWLNADELLRAFKLVMAGEDLAIADGLGVPGSSCAPAHAAIASAPAIPPLSSGGGAPTVSADEDVRERMLSPMILMIDHVLTPDWNQIEEFARELDPDGGWKHVEAADMHVLMGRGTRVMISEKAEPVPTYVYADDLVRSFWYKGDLDALSRHRRHLTIGTALDASAAEWETTRQVAKIVTLITGLLARLPGTVAVYNLNLGTIYEPAMAGGFLSILGRDQIPVQLWVYTLWHSLQDGNVCLSTSGLTPFLGHEIEAWNAPLSAEEARDKVSDLIIYLLDKGPVIGHGDTCGRTKGEKSIRCFRGTSRAERPKPLQALFLEFGSDAPAQPRPDEPVAAAAPTPGIPDAVLDNLERSASPAMAKIIGDIRNGRPAAPAAAAPLAAQPQVPTLRRAGGFGRKGL